MTRRRDKPICKQHGQSLVEVMTAFLILIPIGLVGFDIATFVSAAQQNEQYADLLARTAATKGNQSSAELAVKYEIDHYQYNTVITSISLESVKYDPVKEMVTVTIDTAVKVPIPFPWLSEINCRASSMQPVIVVPASG